MDKAFNKADLAHFDQNLREMVDRSYELCIYNCNEDASRGQASCKQSCYRNIITPFRHATHVARDREENNYRRCLANRSGFPALQQDDFMACSNQIYSDRVQVLTDHLTQEAVRIFNVSRSK